MSSSLPTPHAARIFFQFDLGCEEWRRSVIGSARTAGTLLVLPLTGLVSDRWGRRAALALNAFNTSWLGLARSFAGSYETLLALHVLETSLGAGAFSACFILGASQSPLLPHAPRASRPRYCTYSRCPQ